MYVARFRGADTSGYAEMTHHKRLLDIGWGCGSNLEHLVSQGVERADGVTLSTAQAEWIRARNLPGVTVWLEDFFEHSPQEKYDAPISIEMVDHVCFQAILRNRVSRTHKDFAGLAFAAEVIFPGGFTPRLEELVAAIQMKLQRIN
ncbi:MAG: class I SAM-dependent methyltransferase [Deltaproteobacteria bacterium]|nr:class I SAM-dependent methyltransferase [Deltaproteobacteria bacterium]